MTVLSKKSTLLQWHKQWARSSCQTLRIARPMLFECPKSIVHLYTSFCLNLVEVAAFFEYAWSSTLPGVSQLTTNNLCFQFWEFSNIEWIFFFCNLNQKFSMYSIEGIEILSGTVYCIKFNFGSAEFVLWDNKYISNDGLRSEIEIWVSLLNFAEDIKAVSLAVSLETQIV